MKTLFADLNIKAIVIIEDQIVLYTFEQFLTDIIQSYIDKKNIFEIIKSEELLQEIHKFLAIYNQSSSKELFTKKIELETPLNGYTHLLEPVLKDAILAFESYFTAISMERDELIWQNIARIPSSYNDLINYLQQTNIPIHCLDKFVHETEFLGNFVSKIGAYYDGSKNSRILYIVDKTIGDQNEKGYEIIDTILNILPQEHDLPKPISLIFTSKDPSAISHNIINEYFTIELSKQASSESLYHELTNIAKQCEYVHTITALTDENQKSINQAKEEILKSHILFSKIMHTAHSEGVSPYEAINEWLILAQNYYFSNFMADNLGNIFGSSKVFLDHKPPKVSLVQVNEMDTLNTFEIFDTHVNKKHLPIASGDIFELGEKYFVLVGQDCDISCRSSSTRKTNVAELLEAEICDQKQADKAQMLSKEDETCVIYRHFLIIKDGIQRTMQLKVFVNRLRTCPFEMLDLSVYNSDGKCTLDTSVDLQNTPMNILPKGQIQKYQIMKDSLKKIYSNYELLKGFSELTLGHLTYNYFSDHVRITPNEDNFIIDIGFKRVARLKGNFNYFLNKARQDYIGRIALNGIHFNSEHEVFELKCMYQGNHSVSINAIYDRDQKGWILNRTDLIDLLPQIPHFSALQNDYMVIQSSMGKDSVTKIDYRLADDIITMDCPIKLVHEGNPSEKYLYGGNKRYTVSKIIEQFQNIKCVNQTACENIQNILGQVIKLSDMHQYQIADFGIILNFNTTENQLTISKLVSE